MTPPKELTNSNLYQQAITGYDEVLGELSQLLAQRAATDAVDLIDRFQAATHKLLKAHRLQVIDDVTAVVSKHGPALSAELHELERRLRNLELLMRQGDEGEPDDPTGFGNGRR